jgi:hypothetical protein
LDFRKAIFGYIGENDENLELTEYALSATEWAALKQVADWLEAYRFATTQMSTTKQPMLSNTHACFRWLQEHLKKSIAALPESADPVLRDGLVAAHRKISDYFTKFDESRYYAWATCLCSMFPLYFVLNYHPSARSTPFVGGTPERLRQ